MRCKENMLKDLGVSGEYQAHGGIPADTKDVILAEILIDIRDQLKVISNILDDVLNPQVRLAMIDAGIIPK